MVMCTPPNTSNWGLRPGRTNGTISFLRGSVRSSTMAISIHSATSGCRIVPPAPPPDLRFLGDYHRRRADTLYQFAAAGRFRDIDSKGPVAETPAAARAGMPAAGAGQLLRQ